MQHATTADGLRIAIHDFGGRGPVLLLSHATGFHSHAWLPVIERLTDVFHGVAYDTRGHGESDRSPEVSYPWADYALDQQAVLTHLSLERPFGAGHSAGAATLLRTEATDPGSFAALWCCEPIVFPPAVEDRRPPGSSALEEGARRRRNRFASFEEAIERFSARGPLAAFDPAALDAYVRHGLGPAEDGDGLTLRCPPEHEAAMFAGGSTAETHALLEQVTCPVTLTGGAETDTIRPRFLEHQATLLPSATVEVHDGVGHFLPMEDPAAAAASIRRAFLGH